MSIGAFLAGAVVVLAVYALVLYLLIVNAVKKPPPEPSGFD